MAFTQWLDLENSWSCPVDGYVAALVACPAARVLMQRVRESSASLPSSTSNKELAHVRTAETLQALAVLFASDTRERRLRAWINVHDLLGRTQYGILDSPNSIELMDEWMTVVRLSNTNYFDPFPNPDDGALVREFYSLSTATRVDQGLMICGNPKCRLFEMELPVWRKENATQSLTLKCPGSTLADRKRAVDVDRDEALPIDLEGLVKQTCFSCSTIRCSMCAQHTVASEETMTLGDLKHSPTLLGIRVAGNRPTCTLLIPRRFDGAQFADGKMFEMRKGYREYATELKQYRALHSLFSVTDVCGVIAQYLASATYELLAVQCSFHQFRSEMVMFNAETKEWKDLSGHRVDLKKQPLRKGCTNADIRKLASNPCIVSLQDDMFAVMGVQRVVYQLVARS